MKRMKRPADSAPSRRKRETTAACTNGALKVLFSAEPSCRRTPGLIWDGNVKWLTLDCIRDTGAGGAVFSAADACSAQRR
jgi:hypothetical protein